MKYHIAVSLIVRPATPLDRLASYPRRPAVSAAAFNDHEEERRAMQEGAAPEFRALL
ncbi:hypothetical protein OKW50_001134 [Paraburkholderia youngii]|uniref:Uncharacterized protein n=1 Tax=Paraburkholderia youngii TaxID=2782701 RepID=A0A7W8LB93_9BURK|nr:hypothetical protein [Paraburkholderia youngii]MBB5402461.1 hypothetical protein [Paraburkholderia youngii]